jgi:DNA-binding MarR family transcriptional regulator
MEGICSIRSLIVRLREFEVEMQKSSGLSLNEAMALCDIESGARCPGEIAKVSALTPTRLSRILDSLEAKKLISRSLDMKDRRKIAIELTKAGQSKLKSIVEGKYEKAASLMVAAKTLA